MCISEVPIFVQKGARSNRCVLSIKYSRALKGATPFLQRSIAIDLVRFAALMCFVFGKSTMIMLSGH
jgi:hypothetical protein